MDLEELIERESEDYGKKEETEKTTKKSSKSTKKPTKLMEEAAKLSNAKSDAEGIVSVETEG